MAAKVLILFAHPALHKSRINRLLLEAVRDLENVTINDLYEEYPELLIQVRREQELLRAHDIIVFQHPFFWYSSPAILKEWMDLVLELGFAYGDGGTALAGKRMMNAITTGGPADSYAESGFNRFTIRQFLVPFEQTAVLCGMEYLPPHVIHSTLRIDSRSDATRLAAKYRNWIQSLRDGRVDWDKLKGREIIEADSMEELLILGSENATQRAR